MNHPARLTMGALVGGDVHLGSFCVCQCSMVELVPPSRYFNTEERQETGTTDLISPLIIFTAVLGFELGSLLIGQ